jgi:uncharacterized membrane protein
MKQLIPLGLLVIFIGMALVIIGALSSAKDGNTKLAVGGFIGFIPFGFANDRRMFWALLIVMAFFLIFWVLLNLKVLR